MTGSCSVFSYQEPLPALACPPEHWKHHSSSNKMESGRTGAGLCGLTSCPFVWDSSSHTYCAGVMGDGLPLPSQRPGRGSKLYGRPGSPPATQQSGSPRGFCTQSPWKEATCSLHSFLPSRLHVTNNATFKHPAEHMWSFLMALLSQGRLWRGG